MVGAGGGGGGRWGVDNKVTLLRGRGWGGYFCPFGGMFIVRFVSVCLFISVCLPVCLFWLSVLEIYFQECYAGCRCFPRWFYTGVD